jgi:hypothetical protein
LALPGATHEMGEVSTVELVYPRCAGLDVAKDEVVACARVPDGRGGRDQELRTLLRGSFVPRRPSGSCGI